MKEKLLYSRPNTAGMLDVSVRKVDYLIASQALNAVKIGRRTLITRKSIEKLARTGEGK